MLDKIFMLSHSYGNNATNSKILGIFESVNLAERAIQRYINMPGFINYPDEFDISPYDINREYWEEGFGS